VRAASAPVEEGCSGKNGQADDGADDNARNSTSGQSASTRVVVTTAIPAIPIAIAVIVPVIVIVTVAVTVIARLVALDRKNRAWLVVWCAKGVLEVAVLPAAYHLGVEYDGQAFAGSVRLAGVDAVRQAQRVVRGQVIAGAVGVASKTVTGAVIALLHAVFGARVPDLGYLHHGCMRYAIETNVWRSGPARDESLREVELRIAVAVALLHVCIPCDASAQRLRRSAEAHAVGERGSMIDAVRGGKSAVVASHNVLPAMYGELCFVDCLYRAILVRACRVVGLQFRLSSDCKMRVLGGLRKGLTVLEGGVFEPTGAVVVVEDRSVAKGPN
jgi:hypothetical protein